MDYFSLRLFGRVIADTENGVVIIPSKGVRGAMANSGNVDDTRLTSCRSHINAARHRTLAKLWGEALTLKICRHIGLSLLKPRCPRGLKIRIDHQDRERQ